MPDAGAHGEGEPVRLSVVVIRVLSENYGSDLIGRRQAERMEQIFQRRKDLLFPVFLIEKEFKLFV